MAKSPQETGDVRLRRFQAQRDLLIQAYHKIHSTLNDLRKTEDRLISSEKLASLGQNVAGVGHEINGVLNAISGAQQIIQHKKANLHIKSLHLGKNLDKIQINELGKLINEISNQKTIIDSNQEVNERAIAYSKKLANHQLLTTNKEEIVSLLASLQIELNISKYYNLLRNQHVTEILDYCYQYQHIEKACLIIEDSVERAKKILYTLKTHVYDNKGNLEDVNLVKSIDAALTILNSRMKTITVERDYDENEFIVFADADKLGQVWINLITNALDASSNKGKITIGTFEEDEYYVVYIQDQGCGINHKDLKHIYQAFFTTKPKGKGTGLGLSIVKRIVEEQGGIIQFETEEGEGTKVIIKFKKK